MQGLDDAIHVGDLAVVGIEGEVDIDAADGVDRHFAAGGGRGGGGRWCGREWGRLAREAGRSESARRRGRGVLASQKAETVHGPHRTEWAASVRCQPGPFSLFFVLS